MVDKNIKSGPMDRASDSIDKSKNKLDKKVDGIGRDNDEKKNPLKRD